MDKMDAGDADGTIGRGADDVGTRGLAAAKGLGGKKEGGEGPVALKSPL